MFLKQDRVNRNFKEPDETMLQQKDGYITAFFCLPHGAAYSNTSPLQFPVPTSAPYPGSHLIFQSTEEGKKETTLMCQKFCHVESKTVLNILTRQDDC